MINGELMSVDLHIHSTYSDGTNSPTDLVLMAKRKLLTTISITDHDTAEGISEALQAAANTGVEVIPGIELSVVHEGQHLHLLGYFIDPHDHELSATLNTIQNARLERNDGILAKLRNLGVDITLSEVRAKSKIGQTGRPHIAQVLVDKGVVRTIDEAFSEYLKKGRPAHVERQVLQCRTAIALILGSGGIPVLAHPGSIDPTLGKLPALLKSLVEAGLHGIEVYYPIHSRKICKNLKKMAAEFNLVVTGGSDYHGDIRPGTSLAGNQRVRVPQEVVVNLKKRLALVHAAGD